MSELIEQQDQQFATTEVATMPRHPEVISKASQAWGISEDGVVPFMLKTVVSGTRNYTPSKADCIHVLIVALNYQLNPFTKELYAIVDKGRVIPVVGVDGWSRIVNSRGNFDGAEFECKDDPESGNPYSCTCSIYCKDRKHPVSITEYFSECNVPPRNGKPGPWQSHPRRMLRHKAFIQCARIAFALTGIYDPDEAERIAGLDYEPGSDIIEIEGLPISAPVDDPVSDNQANAIDELLDQCKPDDRTRFWVWLELQPGEYNRIPASRFAEIVDKLRSKIGGAK